MHPNTFKKFKTTKKIWQMFLLFFLLITLLCGFLLLNITSSIPKTGYIFITILLVLFIVIILFSILSISINYVLSNKGVLLKSPIHQQFIEFVNLASVELLSKQQSQELWHQLLSEGIASEVDLRTKTDTSAYNTFLFNKKNLTRFCTIIPITFTSGFDGAKVKSNKTIISGDFILLSVNSGEQYLITPKHAREMLTHIAAITSSNVKF